VRDLKSDPVLRAFAEEIGPTDAVSIVGSGSTGPHGRGRVVRAPSGILEVRADEMTVRCRAGTPVAELSVALAELGQRVALPTTAGTVGGALARGRSDHFRLGRGPVRDTLLGAVWIDHRGGLVAGGGPTVKNVSGFDLPRLMVGSWGTLGALAEVILRTNPVPRASGWFRRSCSDRSELFAIRVATHRPVSLLWDGADLWMFAEGHPDDLTRLADDWTAVSDGPVLPESVRTSLDPEIAVSAVEARDAESRRVTEVGVGIVHSSRPLGEALAPPRPDPRVVDLCRRVKTTFDPSGRFNPGVDVLDLAR